MIRGSGWGSGLVWGAVLEAAASPTSGGIAGCPHPCGWGAELALGTPQDNSPHFPYRGRTQPRCPLRGRPGGLGWGRCPPLRPPLPVPPRRPFLLTQQEQAVCRFISQPLFLQLLLDFFVGFSLRFLIDTLILRFAVAQTPHSRGLGGMSNRCLYGPSIYRGEEGGGGGGRRRVCISCIALRRLLFSSSPPARSHKMVSGRSPLAARSVASLPRRDAERRRRR